MDMWRGEERVRYLERITMERYMETYMTICKIDSQWEFAVWLRKLNQGLCINLEGCDGEGDGREVQKGGYMYILWLIHVEVSENLRKQNSVQQLSFNKKIKRKWWYIYTMQYYSAIKKSTSESVLMQWMKLEPIIQSEVSQREKH